MPKIMIIDDDVEFAENLSLVLKKNGHAISLRDRIEGAVEDLQRDKPDLVILDVMFPDNPAAGFDLARKIRRTPEIASLPIILLTGVNQEFPMDFSATDIDADWMPVQAFVEKPADIRELVRKVAKLIQSSSK